MSDTQEKRAREWLEGLRGESIDQSVINVLVRRIVAETARMAEEIATLKAKLATLERETLEKSLGMEPSEIADRIRALIPEPEAEPGKLAPREDK